MSKDKFILIMKEALLAEKKELIFKANNDYEIDSDGDETDEVQANAILALTKQLSTRNFLNIKKIEAALDRINNNTYGFCEDCEEDIPEKRLSLNPCFETCVICAEKRELASRR